MAASADVRGIRLAELVGALSYGADLGLGQPMQHCLRQTVIGLRLADLLDLDTEQRRATYYLGMLMNAYCHADATEQAAWFGDEIAFKRDGVETLGMNTAQMVALLLRRMVNHGSPRDRARRIVSFPTSGQRLLMSFPGTHSTLGSQFAKQIGLDDIVCTAVSHSYEQWDGKGQPRQLTGSEISPAARIVQLAGPVETFTRRHGAAEAQRMVRRHAGKQYDPAVAEAFCTHAEKVLADLDEASRWEEVLAAEPGEPLHVRGPDVDQVLEGMADLVDMKSPYLAGHSRGVANLAAEAARTAGMAPDEVETLRRAGWVHDLGRLGVSNVVWDKQQPLTEPERERVRLHPYLTERILAHVASLGVVRDVAARHHERLDGSGYPHGLPAAALTPCDRMLAAADAYHAFTEPRPHRPAMDAADAAGRLRAEAEAGRLDAGSVHAVLTAAGHRAPAPAQWPAGLTNREVDVLRLLARGHTNRQIARQLSVSPKTVSNHVEHVYTKISVSSRAAATLFATQHALMGHYQPE